jgi:hypothetical protein
MQYVAAFNKSWSKGFLKLFCCKSSCYNFLTVHLLSTALLTSDSQINQAKIPERHFTTKPGNGLNEKQKQKKHVFLFLSSRRIFLHSLNVKITSRFKKKLDLQFRKFEFHQIWGGVTSIF